MNLLQINYFQIKKRFEVYVIAIAICRLAMADYLLNIDYRRNK